MERSIAQLRHLYQQMLDGNVKDTEQAALGLLGPVIEDLEKFQQENEVEELKRIIKTLTYDHLRQCRYCLRVDGEEHGPHCGIKKILKGFK